MKFSQRLAAKAGAAILCIGGVLSNALPAGAEAQWSQFLLNSSHTSYLPDPGVTLSNASQFGVKWMANLFSASLTSPVVAYNTTLGKEVVYVGDERGDIYALDANTGQVLWSTNLTYGGLIRSTPAVAPDGTVWAATSYDPTLYKLNGATGQVLCSVKSGDNKAIDGSIEIATPPGGSTTVYWNAVDNGSLTNPLGPMTATNESTCAQTWNFNEVDGAWSTPTYGVNGAGEPLVLVGTANPGSTEVAYDALTGKTVWSYYTNPLGPNYDIGAASTYSPPGTNGFANGVAYVNNQDGNEVAVDLNTGQALWSSWVYPSGYSGRRYMISSAALDGNQIVLGFMYGLASLNATTGATNWNVSEPAGVLSSPAIVGPSGSEVVAFGDLYGQFHLYSLTSGSPLYQFQTGAYIVGSPAVNNGTIYITSTDGFLYAFAAGGGNGARPSQAITMPKNGSTVANPNGSLTASGTATDGASVKNVEIAIQANGLSGPWWNGTTATWQSAPYRNEATLSSPGTASTTWTYQFPVPAAGGSYQVFANAVNGANLVAPISHSSFTVTPSTTEPTMKLSAVNVATGATFTVTASNFKAGETVTFTLFGNTVGTATANSSGDVPATKIAVPSTAPFGQTSLTATGGTSGLAATAPINIMNEWTQFGYNSLHSAEEPNDDIISNTINVKASILNVDWIYTSTAAINDSPAVARGMLYFGNDQGVLTALYSTVGSPAWTYTIASASMIRSSPAVDLGGRVIFGANDGNLYVVYNGQLKDTIALGGDIGSPAFDDGKIIVASSNGGVYSIADPAFTENWSANAGAAVTTAPAYDGLNSTVVVGTSTGSVIAYNASTGAQLWTATTGGSISGVVISNGVVYAGSADSNLYAFAEQTGKLKWKAAGDGTAVTSVAFHKTGPSFGTAGGWMYDLTATGSMLHSRRYTAEGIVGLGGAGQDVFGTSSIGNVELLRDDDGAFQYNTGSTFGPGSGPVELDGMLYVGDQSGDLTAFVPEGYNPPPPSATVNVGTVAVTINAGCSSP
jgi:outer membrane protein assembly factor BamB